MDHHFFRLGGGVVFFGWAIFWGTDLFSQIYVVHVFLNQNLNIMTLATSTGQQANSDTELGRGGGMGNMGNNLN